MGEKNCKWYKGLRYGCFIVCLGFLVLELGIFGNVSGQTLNPLRERTYKYIAREAGVFNHGSRRLSPAGIAITTDLCPSTKPWNRSLYEGLVALGEKRHKPFPVGIAVSGRWMQRYPKALARMIQWDREGKLAITWINHSDTHPVKGNFLVNPNVDFTKEVETQAIRMRDKGIFNSPYFRFPGLIFNFGRLRELAGMRYIAVGSDAWLAKGQRVRNGSIILVHGNGNEKFGVRLLFIYLKLKEKDILQGNLRILSLDNLLMESAHIDPQLKFISRTQPASE
jgi:hypothetical protein